MTKNRKRRRPEQIVRAIQDGQAMLNAGKSRAAVLPNFGVSEATRNRWLNQYCGMKSEKAKRLRELEIENQRLKELLAEAELNKQILKTTAAGNF